MGRKRKEKEELTSESKKVKGHETEMIPPKSWMLKEILFFVWSFLEPRSLVQNKLPFICKYFNNLFRSEIFAKIYVHSCICRDEGKQKELDYTLQCVASKKKQLPLFAHTYGQLLQSTLTSASKTPDFSSSMLNFLDQYNQTKDLDVLDKMSALITQEKTGELFFCPLTLNCDGVIIECENYEARSVRVLKDSTQEMELNGLDNIKTEKRLEVFLDNGYPIEVSIRIFSGRYDGYVKISFNNLMAFNLEWYEGGGESNNDERVLQLLRENVFFFKMKSDEQEMRKLDESKLFATLLFVWVTEGSGCNIDSVETLNSTFYTVSSIVEYEDEPELDSDSQHSNQDDYE